jgi:large subunit ribosomal protein L35
MQRGFRHGLLEIRMPKMKTHRGAAKRFRMTASGKIVRSKSLKQHILTSKTTKRKRNLRKSTLISAADTRRVQRLLPNG